MMSPELVTVLARVQEEIGVQMDLLDREGPGYVLYVLNAGNKGGVATHAPAGMNPHIRRMVRELTLDELCAIGPSRLPVSQR